MLAVTACSDDVTLPDVPAVVSGDKIEVDISLNIADISPARSRAFSDTPDYSNLKLYVLEFELRGDDPIGNPMSHNYNLEEGEITEEKVNADGDIHFKITLAKTDQPRVLHFIAVPAGTDLQIGSQNEGLLIPSLSVDNETPAYWHRMEFPRGYGTYDAKEEFTPHGDLETRLEHIPMLCNFARITMAVNIETGGNAFTLEGFDVINLPAKGTVAPWNSVAGKFPDFVSGNSLVPYATISAAYSGYWPFDPTADIANTDPVESRFTTAPKYLYERPHSSLYNPVIIMKGHKDGGSTMYYKLDMGAKNSQMLFDFYNILRNFSYDITVTKVEADGYATAQEALDGVVYNNLSFDVNTRQMQTISDGTNMIGVNGTTFVVTNDNETVIKFLYRFKTNIDNNGGTVNNDTVAAENGGRIAFKDLVTGEAIEKIEHAAKDDDDGWREITITTYPPTGERKAQDFIIYDTETGLGRTIRIVVRNPWEYIDPTLYGVNYDTYDQYLTAQSEYGQWKNVVSSLSTGQPLTIGFKLANDIPEALFPLKFEFEANPQNIMNNPVGNLLVNTSMSLFNTITRNTIHYVKTVTWVDYNTELSADNPTAAKVTIDGTVLHFVRARFLTMATPTSTQTNTIRVYSPYIKVRTGTDADGKPTYNNYLDLTYTPDATAAGPDLAQ